MQNKRDLARQRMQEIAQHTLPQNNLAAFFEEVYTTADGDTNSIPWADLQPHPLALQWLERGGDVGAGKSALVVGCGLGDDAEELARRGFRVTAFDISPRAIAWCRQRFPASSVDYHVCDLLNAPATWQRAFDFVLEIYTVQATPLALHARVSATIGNFVAPGGHLLVICRAREPKEEAGPIRWPLTRDELAAFAQTGLREISCEEVKIEGGRHFRVLYERA